jgi:hypothetical protein
MAAAKMLMTAAEVARTGPETDGCELIPGEVVKMPPPGVRVRRRGRRLPPAQLARPGGAGRLPGFRCEVAELFV